MPWLSIAVIVYGIAVAAGGVMGFAMKGSVASLVSGGVSGILLMALGVISKDNPKFGFGISAGIALALIGLFVFRYLQTKSPMPAFGVIGLSVVMLVLLVVGHFMKSGTTAP